MIPWLSATLLLEVVYNVPIVMITISSKNYCYFYYHYYYYFYWYLLEVLICRNTFHDIIKQTLEYKHWYTLFMLHSIFARTLRLIIDGIRAIRGHTSNKISNTSNRVIAVGFVYSHKKKKKKKTTIFVTQNANVNFDKFYVTISCCEDFYCRVLTVLYSKSLPLIFCHFRF